MKRSAYLLVAGVMLTTMVVTATDAGLHGHYWWEDDVATPVLHQAGVMTGADVAKPARAQKADSALTVRPATGDADVYHGSYKLDAALKLTHW